VFAKHSESSVRKPPFEPLPLHETPSELAAQLRHLPDFVFFDTSMQQQDRAISILGAWPERLLTGSIAQDWHLVEKEIAARKSETPDDGMPRGFLGGWIDYESQFCLGIYEHTLVFDHADESWHGSPRLAAARRENFTPQWKPVEFQPHTPRNDFLHMVRTAREYIAAGDIYQVNLSQQFSAEFSGDAWAYYERLRSISPAPYSAWLDLGERQVLSTSPECFLQMSGRHIRTRPIKGTRPRFAASDADEKSAYDLLTSPKEIAELVMITDLERNDLGQVCDFGSVRVSELLKMERYEQVFHLVSTVEGHLRDGITQAAALAACFPGGSITGAPKKRAREIIAELEPDARGLYTGALGFFGFNGESRFNIAIRTVIHEQGRLHFRVGAGIVADSDPEREYEETLHKAQGLLLAAGRGLHAGAGQISLKR